MPNFLTSGALLDRHSVRIQEVISDAMMVFAFGLDPIWTGTVATSQGVGNMGRIGRDLRIIKTFSGGLTGVIDGGRQRNDFSIAGDDTTQIANKLHLQNIVQTFPDPLDGPNPQPFDLAIPMRSDVTNILFTLGEQQLEANPNTVGNILANKMAGFARNLARKLCNSWYVNQGTRNRLCTITNVSSVSSSGNFFEFTFEPNNLATQRYEPGMRIDIFNPGGVVRLNDSSGASSSEVGGDHEERISCWVAAVDGFSNTVTAVSDLDPDSDWVRAPANNDEVHYANTYAAGSGFTNFAGLYHWLKTGSGGDNNFLLGSERDTAKQVDVTSHPEFKSFERDMLGAALTEGELTKILARYHATADPLGFSIDTLVGPTGVWQAYWEGKFGLFTLERDRRTSSLAFEGRDNTFRITVDGRSYTGVSTEWMESGEMIGYRRMGNWERYVPPKPMMTTPLGEAPPYVPFQFLGSGLGGSARIPYTLAPASASAVGTLVTEGYQMPGDLRMQLVPDQTMFLRLHNLADERIYSDQ